MKSFCWRLSMRQSSYDGSASLYLIPTPIGNLDDITVRALKVLEMVDFILCEDTRESSKLLNHFNIKKRLVSCHEYNEDKIKKYIVSELKNGKNIGLITDQGSPIVSDPGYVVSKAVIDNHFNVIALPGATAFVPALTSSGLSPSPFLFYGFLQTKESKIKKELISLSKLPYTLIFYEAPHRIEKTLMYMLEVFGNRNISIHREISKLHEEICRGTIQELIPIVPELKGEFVVVVDGNHEDIDYSSMSILEHINLYLDDGMSEKDAIKTVAKERGVAKSIIYKEYHENKNKLFPGK